MYGSWGHNNPIFKVLWLLVKLRCNRFFSLLIPLNSEHYFLTSANMADHNKNSMMSCLILTYTVQNSSEFLTNSPFLNNGCLKIQRQNGIFFL